jgi:hypothetical protein
LELPAVLALRFVAGSTRLVQEKEEKNMKKDRLIPVIAGIVTLCAGSALGQNPPVVDPMIIPVVTPRYVVAFAKTEINTPIRSATVVTVTNNADVSCLVAIDWFDKLNSSSLCSNGAVVPAGQTMSFCSRALPSQIADCSSACSVTSADGRASVNSRAIAACGKIAVDARVYYTAGGADAILTAISDPKIVRAGSANSGE